MPAPQGAPEWAAELTLAFESGASGQFVLYGNVHDRLAVGGPDAGRALAAKPEAAGSDASRPGASRSAATPRLVNIERYLQDELLAGFAVVFAYDLGNGLTVERGGDRLAKWLKAEEAAQLPKDPLDAVRHVSRYVRYLANLNTLGRGDGTQVAMIVRGADQLLPADGSGFEHGSLTSLVREWAAGVPFTQVSFASILISDNLNDLEPLVAFSPHVTRVRVPLPSSAELQAAVTLLQKRFESTIPAGTDLQALAGALTGVSVSALEQLIKMRAHTGKQLQPADFAAAKKQMVERDATGLVEFVDPKRTLADYHGQESLKKWLRQDVALWSAGDLKALPMGYLLCGPIGTGKTFLVECLAGEAGAPVLKLKNFRDRWVGSSEGNLEKIFRLIRALGRCIVFIDEADQSLGRRDSGTGDSGLSGRLYSMIAQEMADTGNRGKVVWILASSRPDLIEVDLKRPGRVDVKVPLLPTTTQEESAGLIGALARRYGLAVTAEGLKQIEGQLPTLLTPGAAEALVVKAYRVSRTESLPGMQALQRCLEGYQNPVPADILEFQIRLAVREATDLSFVPESLRHFATDTSNKA